ncbi:MAG: Fur family transcriptional regulator [Asticcacaulis sp.]
MGRGASRRKNPAIIYDVLAKSARPLTAYQILEHVKPFGLGGPPTVYRALEMLQKDGLVHRLQSINAFVACHHQHTGRMSASFMICQTCGSATEIHDPRLESLLDEWKTSTHFLILHQTVELIGTCRTAIPGPRVLPDKVGTTFRIRSATKQKVRANFPISMIGKYFSFALQVLT